jgi:hypothetical protein
MATTLNSPGVLVSVIDESFYTPAAPGTVPMIFVASASNKTNASKTGTAQGTLPENAGKVWTITSQRDLTDTFGTPHFYVDQSQNPVHGGELNEYGLQAAYSLLAVSSKAYIVRADLDLSQLEPSSSIPTGNPNSGQHWIDTNSSLYGISVWDADNGVFVNKTPLVIDDNNVDTDASGLIPKTSFGAIGSYAVVITEDNQNTFWYKNSDNKWVILGSNTDSKFGSSISGSTFASDSWQTSFPVVTSNGFGSVSGGDTFTINGYAVTIATTSTSGVATTINSLLPQHGVGAKVSSSGKLELYADATAANTGTVTLAGNAIGSLGLTTGTYAKVALTIAPHTSFPQYKTNGNPSGSSWVKTTAANRGASWSVKYYNGATAQWATLSADIYSSNAAAIKTLDSSGGGANIAVGTLYVESNYDHGTGTATKPSYANFKVYRRVSTSPTTITGDVNLSSTSIVATSATTYSFTMAETIAGSATPNTAKTIVVKTTTGASTFVPSGSDIVTAISAAGFTNLSAKVNSDGTLSILHATGGEIHLTDSVEHPGLLTTLGFVAFDLTTALGTANLYQPGDYDSFDLVASNWKPLSYQANSSAPYTTPADGTLWYSGITEEIDIMVHNGNTWVGYKTQYPTTDPNGPLIQASEPTLQSDGSPLVANDIWIDTSGTDLYGQQIYVYNDQLKKWIKQDVTDQETPDGWLFADARWATTGQASEPSTIKALLTSDYLDPDAPDPVQYPQGMHLWNTRRSGFNVKQYMSNHIDVNANNGYNPRYENDPMDGSNETVVYNTDRWVSVSGNNENGSGKFGRHAQRGYVVNELKSLVDSNLDIRDTDTLVFNLIATPGYPELINNMNQFNLARGYTAFVVGDTPMRLKPTGTDLSNWGTNKAGATDNNDTGAVSYNDYMAMFYPSGYTNDNAGNKIVVPPSHMMLRTIAVSDQQSYQWFAPSGIKRGNVSNATAVGYLENGEFKATALPSSLRDVLGKTCKINPIATLNGVGIVNFGNYTRSSGSSSLDRINVSRLVAYLRRQLDILSRPFLFEPNDRTTRNEIKNAIDSLMLELVGQRALYDYIVVCDEINNTKARIDRSELWVDVAIEPVKAVEFIYIPLRLKNTGDIKAGL